MVDDRVIAIISGVNILSGFSAKTLSIIDSSKIIGLCHCVSLQFVTDQWPRRTRKGGKVKVGYTILDKPIIFPTRHDALEFLESEEKFLKAKFSPS